MELGFLKSRLPGFSEEQVKYIRGKVIKYANFAVKIKYKENFMKNVASFEFMFEF